MTLVGTAYCAPVPLDYLGAKSLPPPEQIANSGQDESKVIPYNKKLVVHNHEIVPIY